MFADLVTSLKQAAEISRGTRKPSRVFKYPASRVRDIRERTKLSQSEFAMLIGVSIKTLQNWEQARRKPRGPAAALLRIVDKEPEIAVMALHS
jgi:putative transcriptional regulator